MNATVNRRPGSASLSGVRLYWRLLVRWRGELGRKGRIVERKGRFAAARGENDWLGGRDVATDLLAKDERATQDAVSSVVQVEVDERRASEGDPPMNTTRPGAA
jgi:hypothetical protein